MMIVLPTENAKNDKKKYKGRRYQVTQNDCQILKTAHTELSFFYPLTIKTARNTK